MQKLVTIMLISSSILLLNGCGKRKPAPTISTEPIAAEVTDRTIGDLCELLGYQPVRVQGYSLIWGLHGTGSDECPPSIRATLLDLIMRTEAQKYMSAPYSQMTAEGLIDSRDTAAVLVSGDVPPGVPKGGIFNVNIRIPWSSQATSLQGGYLMPTDLQEVVLGDSGPIVRPISARAIGPVFTDPFNGGANKSGSDILLTGTVLGGGRSIRDRRIQLALMDPDYRVAQHLQRRIDTRFGSSGVRKVADALDRSRIEISVPEEYHDDYEHFFKLLLALYFRDDIVFQKQKLQELSNRALEEHPDYEQIALEWEAIGRQALVHVEPFYLNAGTELSFYAARTALNLGDTRAIDTMVQIGLNDEHPRQMDAIEQLGEYSSTVRANRALIELLNHPVTRIRLLAYEGLRKIQDPRIRTYDMPGGFKLELVETIGQPMIYVWADVDPRIILFGKNIVARREVFYETPEKQLTLNARPDDSEITVIRILPGDGKHVQFTCSMVVDRLVTSLARSYEQPSNPGAGLTFSQITGVLKDLSEQGIIPAQFHLHTRDTQHGETVSTEGQSTS